MVTPKVIVPPDVEPLTIDECRAQLEAARYGDTDDDTVDDALDAQILGWQIAAREYCEDFLGLSLSPRVLEIALDAFPTTAADGRTYVELPMGPVTSIVSVSVGEPSSDESDGDTELAADEYTLDDYRSPARLVPTGSWPSDSGTNAIKIRYEAGYAIDSDGVSDMPRVFRAAMLLVIGHFYANREETTEKAMQSLPLGAEALMRPRRVLLGMA